ncbi:MAG: thioredoxin [Patescibacteria group bacterium]|jgi:thioredoxin 1
MSEIILDDSNFESEVLKSDKPILVDFFATWCGPCRMQGPIVEEVAVEIGDKAKVGKMDVDACPQTSQKFEVMSIPTIIIFKGGQAVKTFVGLQDKQSLIDEINKVI